MTTELHLFAGIGGGILAGQMLGHMPLIAVEKNKFCREVLTSRFPHLRELVNARAQKDAFSRAVSLMQSPGQQP